MNAVETAVQELTDLVMIPGDMLVEMTMTPKTKNRPWTNLETENRFHRMSFHWMTMGMIVFASIVIASWAAFPDTPVSHIHPSAAPTTPAPSKVPSKTPSKAPTTSVPSTAPTKQPTAAPVAG